MKSAESNLILQNNYNKIVSDLKSSTGTYQWHLEMDKKSPACTSPDEYSAKTCESLKNGELLSISKIEDRISEVNKQQKNDIADVQQIITWSVINSGPPSITMLSAKYKLKMSSGQEYELNQGREVMPDVYINANTNNPVRNLARQLLDRKSVV